MTNILFINIYSLKTLYDLNSAQNYLHSSMI